MQLTSWYTISVGARSQSHLYNGLSQPYFQGFGSPQK